MCVYTPKAIFEYQPIRGGIDDLGDGCYVVRYGRISGQTEETLGFLVCMSRAGRLCRYSYT